MLSACTRVCSLPLRASAAAANVSRCPSAASIAAAPSVVLPSQLPRCSQRTSHLHYSAVLNQAPTSDGASMAAEKMSKAVSVLNDYIGQGSKASWDCWFLADDVVLHKDDIAFDHDVKGKDTVISFLKQYAQQFSGVDALQVAFSHKEQFAFALFVNKAATLQSEASARAAEGTASQGPLTTSRNATEVLGMAFYDFTPEGAMKDIYVIRQLTAEEMEKKLRHDHSLEAQINAMDFVGTKSDAPGHGAINEVLAITNKYSHLWNHGNVAEVKELLAPDVVEVDALGGSKQEGVEAIAKMMAGVNKGFETFENTSKEAATGDASNAFVFWSSKSAGKGKDESESITFFGISLLRFNADKKITKILSLRQPLPEERKKLFKV